MCDVCVAINLMGGQTVKVTSVINGNDYELKGTSLVGPDAGPCSYFLRKNGAWTRKIQTEKEGHNDDLATIVAKAGFDIGPQYRQQQHDDFIEAQFKLYSKN